MLVGNYLNQNEIDDLVNSLENQKKFTNLISEMKKFINFEFIKDDLDVILGLKFDVMRENELISAQSLYLQITEDVRVRYIRRFSSEKPEDLKDFFVGEILNSRDDGDGLEVLNFKAENDFYITLKESHWSEEALVESLEQNKKEEEEFPINADYYPGMLAEIEVGTEAWYSGCLPGGYRWCGEGCGGSIACNSSTHGVNSLDACCKNHDCCYARNGAKHPNCYCDRILCNCSQNAPFAWNKAIVEVAMCFSC